MISLLSRFKDVLKRVLLFGKGAFAPEAALLSRLASHLGKLKRIRVKWVGVLVLSLLLHLCLLPLLPKDRTGENDGNTTREFRFTLRLPPPRRPEKTLDPLVPPPETEEPITEKEPAEEPRPEEKEIADSSPPPQPAVFGTGAGPTARGGGGGKGKGEGLRGRAAVLQKFGGSAETEEAVRRGLAWLSAHQAPDGRWDCDDFSSRCPPEDKCGGSGNPQYDVGVTALSLAAFAAQGPQVLEAWPGVVEKAELFLLDTQTENGGFGPEEASFMYNQALAVYALAVSWPLKRSERVRNALRAALGYAERTQQRGGGWDYTSQVTGRNDLSITGWQILALDACRDLGLDSPPAVIEHAHSLAERMVDWDRPAAVYADSRIGAGERRPGLLPVALAALLLSGEPVESPGLARLADAVLKNPPQGAARVRWNLTGQSAYYWYYATFALFHLGEPWWSRWNPEMKKELLRLQRSDGHAAGSWDPDPNWIGKVGGRVYATAISVLTLEIYYRVKPKFLEGERP